MRWFEMGAIEKLKSVELQLKLNPFASAHMIGMVLGASRNAIIGVCHRNGISLPRKPRSARGPDVHLRRKPIAIAKVLLNPRPLPPQKIQEAPKKPKNHVTDGGCQWPHGDPGEKNFWFCGGEVARGSYCTEHAARAFRNPGVIEA